ncbi:uncharacterized protein ddias isoform X2 [Engraulis encrasicolus]|uniref:uncharacterized protein ddias isoform X2 n=1 Tax=Engraulis encrasicolus TaxID=184585 RepID=UPI002FD1A786
MIHSHKMWSCTKCGWDSEVPGYRYRLSLRVSKDCDVLGVTVFGRCLDSFFGVTAGQFQRFVTAIKESQGVEKAELLLRKSLEDCFVGRCVHLGIKFPDSGEDHGSMAPLSASLKTEQHIAGKISLPSDGAFGVSVIRYLQSLLRACAPSDRCEPPEASLQSEQSSYHDYTQLCSGGSCLHSSDTDSQDACFPLPVLQSPGLHSELGDSLERSTPEQQRAMGDSLVDPSPGQGRRRRRCRSTCDVSYTNGSCRCLEGVCARKDRRVSMGQESGYSDHFRDGGSSGCSNSRDGESCGSFPVPFIPDESWTRSCPLSFSDDGLSADSVSTSSPPDKLRSKSSCSLSMKSPSPLCRRDTAQLRGVSCPPGPSTPPIGTHSPSCSFGPVLSYSVTSDSEDTWEKNTSTTPKDVESFPPLHGCEEVYNYSAELFDMSALDTTVDFHRAGFSPEKVTCKSRTSSRHYARPRLAPCSQSTPIVCRGATGARSITSTCPQNREVLSERGRVPSFEAAQWESDRSVIDSEAEGCIDEGGLCISETNTSLTREEADWSRDLFVDS